MNEMKFPCQIIIALLLLPFSLFGATSQTPNIVLLYADDLGYGDLGCYGATKIPTPHMDRLAKQGLRFTDGHSASATCTPSRFALLTGEYAWRKKGTQILPGDAALIIPTNRSTLPSILQKAGYRTGLIGKWHLGLGGRGGPDWNGEIKPGPLEVGFDYCFMQPSTGDRVPCVYVENHRVVGLDSKDPIKVSYREKIGDEPTGKENPELLKQALRAGHEGTIIDGFSRIGYMTGGHAARWKDAEKADILTAKALDFIKQNADRPFFLKFSAHDPHAPRVPHPRFVGKSGCGTRGDVIVEFDWCVGQIVELLDKLNLSSNTMVIVTSDNGPVVGVGYEDGATRDLNGHEPAGPFRGYKMSAYEGGTRVPFIVTWPGRIKPGVSDALVSQVDFTASFAALTGQKIPAGDARDSENVLPALLGESQMGRTKLVVHDGFRVLGLRDGKWKYIQPVKNARDGESTKGELYNLESDLAEKNNLIASNPEMAQTLSEELQRVMRAGPASDAKSSKENSEAASEPR
ncbi:MAG: hypothetical protein RIR37_646 [Verrucomicrobiota bacterium]